MSRLERTHVEDDTLGRMQDRIAAVLEPLLAARDVERNFLVDVALKSGVDNDVPHGLGRPVKGWRLTRIRADARVWDSQDANLNPSYTLRMRASAAVTVDLEVF